MLATITPSQLSGRIGAIASKSMAHRYIIAAAMADKETHVVCNTSCEDIEATVRCLQQLGAQIEHVSDGFTVKPTVKSVKGGILRALSNKTLDCGESGSTLRFMLPVSAALGADSVFTGSDRLGDRPLSPLSDVLIAAGTQVAGVKTEEEIAAEQEALEDTQDLSAGVNVGHFPITTKGRMSAGTFRLAGDVSSQFITGLLLAAPLLEDDVTIEVHGRLESRPYVNLTIQALHAFGIEVEGTRTMDIDGSNEVTTLTPKGRYRTPGEVYVEGDWSNAAFWLGAAAMGQNPVTISNISLSSSQGDRQVLALLSRFGANILRGNNEATVRPSKLRAFEISAKDIPDLVPVISAVASVAQGVTFINDCERLTLKESNRLETTCEVLSAIGADVEVRGSSLIISGKDLLEGGEIDAHNDHRIAMMAAIAATRCRKAVRIHGAECVNKSYPDFFKDFKRLGGDCSLAEE